MNAEKRTAISTSPTWNAAFSCLVSPRGMYWSTPSMNSVRPTTHMGQSVTRMLRVAGLDPPSTPPTPAKLMSVAVRLSSSRRRLRPRSRCVTGGQADGLHLQEAPEALGPELPADTRFLEPTEGRRKVDRGERVEHVGARAHLARHTEAAVVVVRPDRSAEAVVRVVGDLDCVVVPVVRDHDEHRPENLLLGDLHLVVDVGEDGRLDVPTLGEVAAARAPAADGHRRALFASAVEVALDTRPLPLGDDRPDLGRGVHGVTDLHGGYARDHRVDDLGVAGTRCEDPRLRDASLPVVHDGVGQQCRDRRGQIGVIENDRRRLAAELERAALEALAAQPADALSADTGAGEAD